MSTTNQVVTKPSETTSRNKRANLEALPVELKLLLLDYASLDTPATLPDQSIDIVRGSLLALVRTSRSFQEVYQENRQRIDNLTLSSFIPYFDSIQRVREFVRVAHQKSLKLDLIDNIRVDRWCDMSRTGWDRWTLPREDMRVLGEFKGLSRLEVSLGNVDAPILLARPEVWSSQSPEKRTKVYENVAYHMHRNLPTLPLDTELVIHFHLTEDISIPPGRGFVEVTVRYFFIDGNPHFPESVRWAEHWPDEMPVETYVAALRDPVWID